MGDVEMQVNVEKQVTETAVFTVDVPLEFEDEEPGSTELTVQVEVTDGKRVYSITTEGDFDIMDHAEAHALFHMLDQALQWNPKEES